MILMGKLKLWHWALVAVSLYEIVGGVMEIAGNNAFQFAGGTGLPTVGTLAGSVYDPVNTSQYMGAIDIATGLGIFFIPLHGALKA
jgi:hypothetical protein